MKTLNDRKPVTTSMTFYCFTPLVSLGTFILEILFALYVFISYKSTLFRQLTISLLVSLGIFQLSEYLICTTSHTEIWVKIGYLAITTLPALGMHITTIITKRHHIFMYLGYLMASILSYLIIFVPEVNLVAFCRPHYVEVFSHPIFVSLHATYYTIFMLLAVYALWHSMKHHIGDSDEERWMIMSYLVFIVPSIVLFYFKVIVDSALPSVMCGFALLTALIFTIHIVPRYYQIHHKKK